MHTFRLIVTVTYPDGTTKIQTMELKVYIFSETVKDSDEDVTEEHENLVDPN